MKELIANLAAATEGSRELSLQVLLGCGWKLEDGHYWAPRPNLGFDAIQELHLLPNPTTSIDDALTLVPEGWSLAGLWEAVNPKDRPWWGVDLRHDDPYEARRTLGAKTPALALCLAAVKAREA